MIPAPAVLRFASTRILFVSCMVLTVSRFQSSTISFSPHNPQCMLLRKLTTQAQKHTMAVISSKLALGAGCYWGTEKYVNVDFQKKFPNSIKKATVGFMSPDPAAMKDPSYRQVCSGSTGHVEVLLVELNDPDTNFEPLMKFFYQFHDPTTKNRQGNDAGTQYASIVFCEDDAQKAIATKVRNELQELVTAGKVKYDQKEIHTPIVGMNPFYAAEEEHQAYLEKNPSGYCNHRMRFKEWPQLN